MKRIIISVMLVLALSASMFAFAVEPFSTGDVSGDGKILANDARLALRYSAQLEELTAQQITAADVDNSGKVLANDARVILRVSAQLQTFGEDPGKNEEIPASPDKVLKVSGLQKYYKVSEEAVFYYFRLTNTSKAYTVTNAVYVVEAVDGSKTAGMFDMDIINPSDASVIGAIRPGETFDVVGVITGVDAVPSDVTVRIEENINYDENGNRIDATGYEKYNDGGAFGGFEVFDTHFLKSEDGGKITGRIKNNNFYSVKTAAVCLLRINDKGAVTGIDGLETKYSPIAGLPSGGNATFEISAAAAVGANDKFVVCSGGSSEDNTGKVKTSSVEYAVSSSDALGVVFTATNNDTAKAVNFPQFRVTALGAGDTVLSVGYVTARLIAPGASVRLAAEACKLDSRNGDVAGVDVEFIGCESVSTIKSGYKELTTWDMMAGAGSSGGKALTGYVANANSFRVENVVVSAAVYSENGELLYVSYGDIDAIDAGESGFVEISLEDKPVKYDVYVLNWTDAG